MRFTVVTPLVLLLLLSASAEPASAGKTDMADRRAHDSKIGILEHLIVGGVETARGRYPYMVKSEFLGCGGQLIYPDIVLTAAHCFNAFSGKVHVNRWNLDDNDEIYEEFSVAQRITHPDYNDPTEINNDFLLLRLDGESAMTPIKLVSADEALTAGEDLTAVGFGRLSSGGSIATKLMEVEVDYITNTACTTTYDYSGSEITDQMMCAARPGKDSCQGDSGGPLIIKDAGGDPTEDAIVGVVSWGYGCADPDYPGVYARVTSQRDWIITTGCSMTNVAGPCTLGENGPSRPPVMSPTAVPTFTAAPTTFVPIPAFFPAYTASDTSSAQQKTVDEELFVCPGTTLTFSMCGAAGACNGDTYMRLLDASGSEIALNDDTCGVCSSITMKFNAPCQTYTVKQGCFGSSSCGGTVAIACEGSNCEEAAPVTAPVAAPTDAPQSCAPYSASNTNSGTRNTVACPLYVCPGTELTLYSCNGDGKSCDGGDTYLRLTDGSGNELAENDDRCGLCSSITFRFGGDSCQEYAVNQGCYGDEACSGTVQITHESGPPLPKPTADPTADPTAASTTNPTAASTTNPTAASTTNPTAASTTNPTAAVTEAPTEGEDCPGPFPGFSKCENNIAKFIRKKNSKWFAKQGLDGSRCSLQGWFASKRNPKCPPVPGASPFQIMNSEENGEDDE